MSGNNSPLSSPSTLISATSSDHSTPSEVIFQEIPSSSNASIDHLTPPSPLSHQAESSDAPDNLQLLLEQWIPKITVLELKALMAAQQITRKNSKELRKVDLVKLVVAHYLGKSWDRFKADLLSAGINLI